MMNNIFFKIFILIFFIIFAVVIGVWINHLKLELQYEEEDKLVRDSVRCDNDYEDGICPPPDEYLIKK